MSGDPSPALSSLRTRLLSGGAWAFGSKVGAAALYLGVNALLARLLSPTALGTYFLAFSIVALGASIGELGLGRAAVRLVAESIGRGADTRSRAVVRTILQLGAAGAVVTGGIYLAVGGWASEHLFETPALRAITIPVALWIAFTVLQRVFTEVFRGFHEIRLASLFGRTPDALTPATILAATLGLLWRLDAGDLTAVTLSSALAALITVVISALLLSRMLRRLRGPKQQDPEPMALPTPRHGTVLKISLPMLVTILTTFALSFQLDLWLLSIFRPQDEVAIYGAAARLMFAVGAPLMIINAVVPPIIAELDAQGRKTTLERVLRGTAAFGSLPAFGTLAVFAAAGGPILGLLFGDYYQAGAIVLLLLSLGQATNVASGSCAMTLMMTGHETTMMRISFLMAIVAVLTGIIAARYLGNTGMAAVSAGRFFLQNVLIILAVKRLVGVRTYADLSFRSARGLLRWRAP